jgi:hypothetical protein
VSGVKGVISWGRQGCVRFTREYTWGQLGARSGSRVDGGADRQGSQKSLPHVVLQYK